MSQLVKGTRPLGFVWETADPFLFCVHHDDAYPAGNANMAPVASLEGRNIGQDFAGIDGWRMYHGEVVPGFPAHPHRGFETVTIVRRGLVDHSDSLGATARFGGGDVQWLTAGAGIVHAEMMPLVRDDANPLELFQIWLNLPAADKMAPPHFSMFWDKSIPRVHHAGDKGRRTEVTAIAGTFGDARALPPPPRSWAARSDADVAIATIRLEEGAEWTLPAAASARTNRTLYFFDGPSVIVGDHTQKSHAAITVRADSDATLKAPEGGVELLLLQGRPIGEPVVQHGPFVMNTREEIQQAMRDYQRTRFGGWPWKQPDPVHAREEGRFAKHADGRVERAEG